MTPKKTTKPKKGDLGWAWHPRGGVIIDVLGDRSPMPSPYPEERKLGPFGIPKDRVFALSTLPVHEPIYSLSREACERLGIERVGFTSEIPEEKR